MVELLGGSGDGASLVEELGNEVTLSSLEGLGTGDDGLISVVSDGLLLAVSEGVLASFPDSTPQLFIALCIKVR